MVLVLAIQLSLEALQIDPEMSFVSESVNSSRQCRR